MWILFLFGVLEGIQIPHHYTEGEDVILWFNKFVPFNNPQESYPSSHLPLCICDQNAPPPSIPSIGEAIEGFTFQDSGISIKFTKQISGQPLCSLFLTPSQKSLIIDSIRRDFRLQLYLDDLPMWTSLGEYNEASDTTYIYTHYTFLLSHNGPLLIQCKPGFQRPITLSMDSSEALHFSYSVTWVQTETPFAERFSTYLDPNFLDSSVHWFSVMNSFVMVFLLCALVLVVLYGSVAKDYDRYNALEIEANEFAETKGWKQVAGDAFKAPEGVEFFVAAVSTGWLLGFLSLFGIFTSILHPMYSERGLFSDCVVVEYAVLGGVEGCLLGSVYEQYKGKRWIGTAVLTASGFPCFVAVVVCTLNIVASGYSSSAVIPLVTIGQVSAFLIFVYLPLFSLGVVLGKRYRAKRPLGQRVNSIHSPILREKHLFNHPLLLIICGGILPFSSIYVEVYYAFTSFWNYKFYYVYGFTLMSFVLFALSVACVAIVATYSTLNSEDHRWHWISLLSSGSVGLYLYIYAAYYYLFKTQMSGTLQFVFYFAYTLAGSTYLALVAGAIGYTASYCFVHKIYSNIKSD